MKHTCDSKKIGDAMVFTCNLCPDYKRIVPLDGGKHIVSGQQEGILHSGYAVNASLSSGEN